MSTSTSTRASADGASSPGPSAAQMQPGADTRAPMRERERDPSAPKGRPPEEAAAGEGAGEGDASTGAAQDGAGAARDLQAQGAGSAPESAPTSSGEAPYTIFTPVERRLIIASITLAGFLSPVTANIYLPALPAVSASLAQSAEAVQLSVSVYMIFQATSPLLFGTLTDSLGRRPIYIACISLFLVSNIAMWRLPDVGPDHSSGAVYAGLLVLRALQATGSASVVSIGSGSIGDITQPADRGGVMGIFQSGTSVGPSLGPVLGGLLTARFGWRSIFLFLFIIGSVNLLLLVLFLPETLRRLVGNGSRSPPTAWHESVLRLARGQTVAQRTGRARPPFPPPAGLPPSAGAWARLRTQAKQPLLPLRFLAIPEVLAVLVINAAPYASYYMMTSTIAVVFQDRYGFTTLQSALVYLAPGVGSSIAAFVSGRLLDYNFQSVKRELERERARAADARPHTPGLLARTLSRVASRPPPAPAQAAASQIEKTASRDAELAALGAADPPIAPPAPAPAAAAASVTGAGPLALTLSTSISARRHAQSHGRGRGETSTSCSSGSATVAGDSRRPSALLCAADVERGQLTSSSTAGDADAEKHDALGNETETEGEADGEKGQDTLSHDGHAVDLAPIMPLAPLVRAASARDGSARAVGGSNVQTAAEARSSNDLSDFPIERARFRVYPFAMGTYFASMLAYAWTLERGVHPAAPIVFTFLIGFSIGVFWSVASCVLVDFLPGKGASVTAANNLVRCCFGAVGTAVVQYIYNGIGPGWTFTIVGCVAASVSPLVVLLLVKGPAWRKRRAIKEAAQLEREKERAMAR